MKQKPYRYFLYLGLRLVQGLVLLIPRDTALFLARQLSGVVFFLIPKEREKTLRHLSWAYGKEKSPVEIRELGKQVFAHFGQMAVDVIRIPKLNREKLDQLIEKGDGFSKVDQVLSRGKGMILLTAHFGNWELMGALFLLCGYPGTVIGRQIYYDKFNQAILDLRKKVMLRTIYQDDSPREFLKVLKQNGILGILADQDMDRMDGIFIPFFGKPAYTLTAPVKLALTSGAPLVPAFLIREGSRYRLLVHDPIQVEMKTSREETIQEYTEQWSQIVEETIRQYPEQWAWMHRRWKTQPETPSGVAAPRD